MKKWHMIIDVAKCEDCNNCSLACKDEHVGNEWPGYAAAQPLHGQRWMNVERKERGQFPNVDVAYRPTACMQCADGTCVGGSKGAITRRDDGIVLIDPEKAKGQRELVNSCPYKMIWWNEELNVAQKCTFCAHLLDNGWRQPRCVQACPTGALQMRCVDDAEMARIAEAEELECLHPEYKTRPQTYYANLQRFTKCFIAGSVEVENSGKVDCAHGAKVVLRKDMRVIGETTTDAFGDFRFDRLDADSTGYSIEIEFNSFCKKTLAVEKLETSVSLETVSLAALPTENEFLAD